MQTASSPFDVFAVPAPYRAEQFLRDDNLRLVDETIAEVYGMMLGFETAVVPERRFCDETADDGCTAIVGLSGALRGSCEVRMDAMAARRVTSAMLGDPPVKERDASIGDAVGEICNLIAGGWKNRIPALSHGCTLSPPTILSGRDPEGKPGASTIWFTRSYRFAGQRMQITMRLEEAARG